MAKISATMITSEDGGIECRCIVNLYICLNHFYYLKARYPLYICMIYLIVFYNYFLLVWIHIKTTAHTYPLQQAWRKPQPHQQSFLPGQCTPRHPLGNIPECPVLTFQGRAQWSGKSHWSGWACHWKTTTLRGGDYPACNTQSRHSHPLEQTGPEASPPLLGPFSVKTFDKEMCWYLSS